MLSPTQATLMASVFGEGRSVAVLLTTQSSGEGKALAVVATSKAMTALLNMETGIGLRKYGSDRN